jgi:hypothetical protein
MKDLATAMQDAGFSMTDTPPAQENVQQDVQQTEAPVEQAAPPVEEPVSQPESQPNNEPQLVDEMPVQQTQEVFTEQTQVTEPDFSEEEVEAEVLRYVSERLGSRFDSFDSFNERLNTAPTEIDERVAAINNFVRETGRSPEDWYTYQRLNTSEMDDMSAVRNHMQMEHSNLTSEEIDMLVSSKYKLDPDMHTEQDVKMSQLQLKMDAEQARRSIEDVRSKYEAPEVGDNTPQSFITDEWISEMRNEVSDLDGLVFGLPNGQHFTYGLDSKYKGRLIEKNAKLDQYFDDYITDSGNWDFDKLSSHRALIDNIDEIVASVYRQGMSDGQRKVVQNAGNVSTDTSPQRAQGEPSQMSKIQEQLRNALGGNSGMSIKF